MRDLFENELPSIILSYVIFLRLESPRRVFGFYTMWQRTGERFYEQNWMTEVWDVLISLIRLIPVCTYRDITSSRKVDGFIWCGSCLSNCVTCFLEFSRELTVVSLFDAVRKHWDIIIYRFLTSTWNNCRVNCRYGQFFFLCLIIITPV